MNSEYLDQEFSWYTKF